MYWLTVAEETEVRHLLEMSQVNLNSAIHESVGRFMTGCQRVESKINGNILKYP